MANREIKTKVAIDGEKEYKESLKNINSALGTLKSELKLVESQYAGQANSYAALSAKGDVLWSGESRGIFGASISPSASYNGAYAITASCRCSPGHSFTTTERACAAKGTISPYPG